MKLKIKLLKWSAGHSEAMLNRKTARKIGVRANDSILIKTLSKDTKEISTIIDTIDKIVKEDEIAVSSELKKRLNLKVRQKVEINIALNSKSLIYIKKKLNKKSLSKSEN